MQCSRMLHAGTASTPIKEAREQWGSKARQGGQSMLWSSPQKVLGSGNHLAARQITIQILSQQT
jgi:hypothetical protein